MERRLGRGLDSLLSSSSQKARAAAAESQSSEPSSTGHEHKDTSGPAALFLDVETIRPNPFQPRKHFDPEALEELASSLRAHGMLQAVVVRRTDTGFELIAGERRWRAAKQAGLARIPAIVREGVTTEQMLEWAMVENLQRRDLDPIERALGYRQMSDKLGLTQEQVAERVGLKRSTVTNHLRLLELDSATQALLVEGTLSMGHARALLGLSDLDEQRKLAQQVVSDGISVREVERRVRESADAQNAPAQGGGGSRALPGILSGSKPPVPPPTWVHEMEKNVREHLGTRVEVRNQPGYAGQIVIHYDSRADLERVYGLIAPKTKV